MKSIQTKIMILILCSTLIAATVMQVVGYYNAARTVDYDSEQLIQLHCEEKASEINETIRNIEQSVNAMYQFAIEWPKNIENISDNQEELDRYLMWMRQVSCNMVENTEGSLAVYYRLNPEFSSSYGGFFLTKTSSGEFEDYEITDIEQYDRDDMEHVGWYWLPIEAGKSIWMDPYYNKNLGVEMISYVMPVRYQDLVIGVIGMDIDADFLRDEISDVKLYETGDAFLLDAKGNIVYHRDYPQGLSKKEFNETIENIQGLVRKMKRTGGICIYDWNGTKKEMATKTLHNGMQLVVTVPLREIDAPKWSLMVQSQILMAGIVLLSMFLSVRFARSIVRPLQQLTEAAKKIASGNREVAIVCDTKDEVAVLAESIRQTVASLNEKIEYINRIAYTDVMTNTRNKVSYENTVTEIDEAIKQDALEFAVVLMDINDLKKMNDNFGHEMGDLLIRDSAGIMKTVFGDTSVFRIGGDEFAAILMKKERLQYQELMQKFEECQREFNDSDRKKYQDDLQIASGIAVFDREKDKTFADVFRRADHLMYENKRRQKAERNAERRGK